MFYQASKIVKTSFLAFKIGKMLLLVSKIIVTFIDLKFKHASLASNIRKINFLYFKVSKFFSLVSKICKSRLSFVRLEKYRYKIYKKSLLISKISKMLLLVSKLVNCCVILNIFSG